MLENLETRYEEPQRHYHDARHLQECLGEAAGSRELQVAPGSVDLALWFHDAVYDPRRGDNEARSAELAASSLGGRLAAGVVAAVQAMILATRHDGAPRTPDEAVVTDVDLAILGSPPARFAAYHEDVRREYAWVPEAAYRRRRIEVLRSFLDRPRIYATDSFGERYERQARLNLVHAIANLELTPPA